MMEQPPRAAGAPLFSGSDFRKMALESTVISTGSLAAYGYGISRYGQGPRAASMAFQALVFGQLLHAFNCRSARHGLLDQKRPPANPYLNMAVGGSLALQALTLILPGLRGFLGLTPPSLIDTAVIGLSTLLPFFANELGNRAQSPSTQEVTT
jgi:Ca2+-transporting ATPase